MYCVESQGNLSHRAQDEEVWTSFWCLPWPTLTNQEKQLRLRRLLRPHDGSWIIFQTHTAQSFPLPGDIDRQALCIPTDSTAGILFNTLPYLRHGRVWSIHMPWWKVCCWNNCSTNYGIAEISAHLTYLPNPRRGCWKTRWHHARRRLSGTH